MFNRENLAIFCPMQGLILFKTYDNVDFYELATYAARAFLSRNFSNSHRIYAPWHFYLLSLCCLYFHCTVVFFPVFFFLSLFVCSSLLWLFRCTSFASAITPHSISFRIAAHLHTNIHSHALTPCLFYWIPHNSHVDWHEWIL